MLSLLHIENIALLDLADISFGPGLNVLSGETGAGKSIVLDAIGAVMGERTSRDLIRTGEKTARVSAVFSDLPALPWFEEQGIYPDENGELLISRQISADGKNVCRVSGLPCTVMQLRGLGQQLINIHGQHDAQQLLDEGSHLAYLDSFGALFPLLEEYQRAYRALMELRHKMESLTMDEAEKSRTIDTLNFQIRELERAELREGEEEELAEEKMLLQSGGKLMDALARASLALLGDDDQLGAVALLGDAAKALMPVSGLHTEMEQTAESISELHFQADDLAEQIRSMLDQFDFSPEALDRVEERLDILYRLKKKYGATVEEMLAYLERCREDLDNIELSADLLLRLEAEYATQEALALGLAQKLSNARLDAAEGLRLRIEEELSQLDMPKVRFCAEITPREAELPLDQYGMDQVQFLMSANLGEALKPIQKVASGGELARIMLALKHVLTENDSITTLIFDEVDAGISGRAAQKVAEKMGSLGGKRQVLCVTHLAQIAAMADLHLSVEKDEREGRTFTIVTPLEEESRVEELSRLTGGGNATEAMRKSAREMLARARAYKEEKGLTRV